jgi:anti-sigma factor RsiW
VTPPRFPLDAEEEVLLSAYLDGELAAEDCGRVADLLDRPEVALWLAVARRFGEAGRELWDDSPELPAAASMRDEGPTYSIAPHALAPSNGSASLRFLRRFRREPGDGSSKR